MTASMPPQKSPQKTRCFTALSLRGTPFFLLATLSFSFWFSFSVISSGLYFLSLLEVSPLQKGKKGEKRGLELRSLGCTSAARKGSAPRGPPALRRKERHELSCRPPVGFVGRQKGAGNDGRGKEERRRRNALSRSHSLLSSQIKLSPSKLAKKANRKRQNRSGRALSPRARAREREREREKHRVRRVHRREDAPSR